MSRILYAPSVVLLMLGTLVPGAQQPQRPVFRAGADVVLVDAQVVTRDGHPIVDLEATDFEVEIGGRKRRVAAVELVRYDVAGAASGGRTASQAVDAGAQLAPPPPRLYILAVDETSFSTLALLAWKEAIKRFINRLQPTDLVGLYAYPVGGSLIPLTQNHQAVLDGADNVVGRFEPVILRYHMSLAEMVDITRGDPDVIRRVAERECPRPLECIPRDLPEEAKAYAHQVEMHMAQSIAGLRTLMRSLRTITERKTVVVVSGGLFASDQIGGRGDVGDLISAVGQEAAHANANLYVLHLDLSFIEMFSPRVRALPSMLRDIEIMGRGLDRFAGVAGGELIRVQAGTGDYAFERLMSETSAYYLLGVEPAPDDRDGRPRRVTVKVNRRGAIVRSRAWVVIPS